MYFALTTPLGQLRYSNYRLQKMRPGTVARINNGRNDNVLSFCFEILQPGITHHATKKNAVLFAALILRRKYLPVARGKKSGGEGIHTRVAH